LEERCKEGRSKECSGKEDIHRHRITLTGRSVLERKGEEKKGLLRRGLV